MPADWRVYAMTAWPLLVAVAIGYAVHRVLHALCRRLSRRRHGRVYARILTVVALPAAFAVPLLFLGMAVTTTPLPAAWAAGIQRALNIGGILCLTWLGIRVVGAVERLILRRHPVDVADNLTARRVQTQTQVLGRVAQGAVALVGVSIVLMTFPAIRQIGTTLLASAGVLGLVAGIAAKPVFGNLIAGLQIALTQPIRLDDVVIIEGEWGRIEEIGSTYVVVRVWDERRLIVPLQWFIEHPFQNWTRHSAELLGTALLWLDYRTPMDAVRAELTRICGTDPRWDGRVCVAQVTETDRTAIQVRLLVSAKNSGELFDLRCAVRERMIDFLLAHHPEALPRLRANVVRGTTVPDAERIREDAEGRLGRADASSTGSPGAEQDVSRDPAAPPTPPTPLPP